MHVDLSEGGEEHNPVAGETTQLRRKKFKFNRKFEFLVSEL
jgi:hypothetical protein